MLTGFDRQSGEKLDDDNIIAQCITFLVAGHETTSGLLSFALYAPCSRILRSSLGPTTKWTRAGHGPKRAANLCPDSLDTLRQPNSRRDAAVVAHSANLHAPPL